MSKKLYFCNNCRTKLNNIEDLLFVEESKRGFCSEDCIVDFFTPYMKAFDAEEIAMREVYGIMPGEGNEELYKDKEIFEHTLYSPDEVWVQKNDLGEELYTHIHRVSTTLSFILICSYYEGEPAFVFFKTMTNSPDLIQFYRRDVKVDTDIHSSSQTAHQATHRAKDEFDGEDMLNSKNKSLDEISLPAEVVEDIDLKKSEYLADLLERRKDTDISFEEYPMYDDYITLTLDEPDDEYHSEDQVGDKIFTFIKSFQKNGQSFFYIVICLSVDVPDTEHTALMPVITFPSIDEELYKFYAIGEKKNTRLTN